MTAADIKRLLQLEAHPREGGFFARTYSSGEMLLPGAFSPSHYDGPRATSTAIYYLLEPDTFSEMHVLASDEIFHHYLGDAVEMLQLHPDSSSSRHLLGPDLLSGQRPQLAVPRGVWQGSRLLPPAPACGFALLGCTVAPGFDYADYQAGRCVELQAHWPAEADLITKLTRA